MWWSIEADYCRERLENWGELLRDARWEAEETGRNRETWDTQRKRQRVSLIGEITIGRVTENAIRRVRSI